jgi:hypothetical protein
VRWSATAGIGSVGISISWNDEKDYHSFSPAAIDRSSSDWGSYSGSAPRKTTQTAYIKVYDVDNPDIWQTVGPFTLDAGVLASSPKTVTTVAGVRVEPRDGAIVFIRQAQIPARITVCTVRGRVVADLWFYRESPDRRALLVSAGAYIVRTVTGPVGPTNACVVTVR